MQRLLTTAILVGLLVATAAAFAVTERLKLTKSPIFRTLVYPKTGFSPKCGCARGKTTIRVALRRADDVTIRILDSHRHSVRDIVDGLHASRGINIFHWDGRTDANVIAPDGSYRAEIHLAGQHQTIVLPNEILLDTSAPEVKTATPNRTVFSPDQDGQADFVRIAYVLSKPAHVLLYLDGKRILRQYRHTSKGTLSWFGKANNATLPQGTYTLDVGAVDAAGNSTPVAQRVPVTVELRYIALQKKRISVIPGGTFTIGVSTDAKTYRWKLGGRKSSASGPSLTLLASTRRGRYTLTVSENGHIARATVLVR